RSPRLSGGLGEADRPPASCATLQPGFEAVGQGGDRLPALAARRGVGCERRRRWRRGAVGARDLGEEARENAPRQPNRRVGNGIEQRTEPNPIAGGEIAEHVSVYQLLGAGVADADAHARVGVADVLGERAQAVVPGIAAADLYPQLAGGKIEFVVDDADVAL